MGLKLPYEIQCSCGSNFQAELWEYIFAEHDPELKQLVLTGELNHVTCPFCKEKILTDISFLYRDETNKLWVWVCGQEEQEKNIQTSVDERIQGYFLDEQEDYRKFVVSGRPGLLEVLLKEDLELKKTEAVVLKTNPAVKVLKKNDEEGYLFLIGDRIKTIPLPLSCRFKKKDWSASPVERAKWLDFYAEGINFHNQYSSFLDEKLILKWKSLLLEESLENNQSEYEIFAGLWADYKMKGMCFKELFPKINRFFQGLGKIEITRDIVLLQEDFASL